MPTAEGMNPPTVVAEYCCKSKFREDVSESPFRCFSCFCINCFFFGELYNLLMASFVFPQNILFLGHNCVKLDNIPIPVLTTEEFENLIEDILRRYRNLRL